jgi:hypothetical protein
MRTRLLPGLALMCLVAVPWPVHAADEKTQPAILVRVKSIDGLMDDFKYLAELTGKAAEAKQVEGFLKGAGGQNGLEGIDTKKPLAIYGRVGPNFVDSEVVLLVPVADEKAILDRLERFGVKAEKDKDGLYTVSGGPLEQVHQDAYFRFANGYAYATFQNAKNIAKEKLLLPAQVLPTDKTSTFSWVVNIDEIPDKVRVLALEQTELQLGNEKDKKPEESEAEHLLRVALIDEMAMQFKSLLTDGQKLTLSLDIDRKAETLSLTSTLTGKTGSKLSDAIADLAKAKSLGAAVAGTEPSMAFFAHLLPSESFRKQLGPAVDAAFKKAVEDEKDKGKRALGEKFLKLIGPTIKSGEVDVGGSLRGPNANGLFVGVLALKVKDGMALEQAIRDLYKEASAEDKKDVELDFDKSKSVNIHRVKPGKDYSDDAKKALGENPVYFALRDDAFFLSVGEGGLAALKDAIAAEPKAGKTMQFEASMGRLTKLMGKDEEEGIKAAKKAFAKAKNGDRLTITLEGGKSLTLHADVKAQLVTFFNLLNEANERKKKDSGN